LEFFVARVSRVLDMIEGGVGSGAEDGDGCMGRRGNDRVAGNTGEIDFLRDCVEK
jgi:hypothetical protein